MLNDTNSAMALSYYLHNKTATTIKDTHESPETLCDINKNLFEDRADSVTETGHDLHTTKRLIKNSIWKYVMDKLVGNNNISK